MNTRIRPAAWWALGAAATAIVLACSAPSAETGSEGGGDGEFFTESFDSFAPAEFSGEGDGVVELPEGAAQAMVTASHDGDANFAVSALDEGNQATGDLLVNTIGGYEGVTALGMYDLGNEPVRLQVTADGAWTVRLAPLADAPALPGSGTGDAVFRYEGEAVTWNVTHDGDSNFTLSYHTDEDFEMPLLVNEIGAYDGEVPAGAGPGLVVVTADGDWTIGNA
ncbi:hypothetical protein GCM10009853_069300 [Glycomyces scopariae]